MGSFELLAQVGHADRFTSLGYAAVCLMELDRFEEAVETFDRVATGLRASGRALSARLGGPFMLGALAKLGHWQEWDKRFHDFADLVRTKGYSVMFSRIVELSLRHLAEVGENVAWLLPSVMSLRTTTKHGVAKLQSDYGAIFGQLVNL